MSLHCTAAVGFRVVVPMSTLTPTNCSLPSHLFKISPPIHQILLPTNKNGNGFFGTRPNSLSTGIPIPIPIHPRLIITTACRKTTDSEMANQSFQESDQLLSEKKKTTFEIVSITQEEENNDDNSNSALNVLLDWGLLISPFFFWGTAMVAMKEVLPKTGPFFIATFRLIPAGLLLVAFAASRGRKLPSGTMPWLSITLFALVDATCFQGFLAQGLQTTSAGLGSVIIDSQPLTVAVLAALLFGESIGVVGVSGLVLGVVGLVLLESDSYFSSSSSSLWGSGEWWMLLAAQSMAVGTVMVRWVSKYSDPIMATGWHMVIGGVPLLVISVLNHDPAIGGNLTSADILALVYTSIFGSAISYGVYFYNATRGSLTKLSSLTFLTPMFASVFGYFFLEETFTPVQLLGAFITLVSIYLVNYKTSSTEIESEL